MKRSLTTSILIALLGAAFFSFPEQFSDSVEVAGQRRRPRQSVKAAARKSALDYSRFSHATKQHQESCKTCHRTPTPNWQRVSEFPDVADFPDHDACVSCHRPQFFKGARPLICSNCHEKTSPRDAARFSFRNPVRLRQFTIEFPHDKHQDVIARLDKPAPPFVTQTVRGSRPGSPAGVLVSLREWAHARRAANKTTQTNSLRYNNCEICHAPNMKPLVMPRDGWTDNFVPAANVFKTSPDSHASCFNCHWKGQEPTKDNCAGCHKLSSPYVPTGVFERKSLRFTHAREQHVKECTACHINITKAASLRGLKPDVPITSCTECHNKEGLRLDVSGELEAIDKNRAFVCVYCHTSDVGRLDPPRSHYLISGRAPVQRKDIK